MAKQLMPAASSSFGQTALVYRNQQFTSLNQIFTYVKQQPSHKQNEVVEYFRDQLTQIKDVFEAVVLDFWNRVNDDEHLRPKTSADEDNWDELRQIAKRGEDTARQI